MDIAIVGYSSFSWELMHQLRGRIRGRLYIVLADREQAMEAGLYEGVIAIHGDPVDTEVLDQLDLAHCHTFIAGGRDDRSNVLSALYAKSQGVAHVYARVLEAKFMPLLESMGVVPLQTSHTAAAFTAVRILQPSVAELVSLTRGQFHLKEIRAADYPELIGCYLGHLQGESLHIIAVAQEGKVWLGYHTPVKPEATLILIYDRTIQRRLPQELRRVAAQATRLRQGRTGT